MFLEDVYKEFLYDLEIKNYSPRTIKGYKNNNKAFLNYLKNEFEIDELEEVTSKHIKSYLMNLKQKGLKELYINSVHKCLRSYFKFMVEEGYIAEKRNPILSVKFMKEPKVIIKTFTDDEIKRMINAFPNNNYLNLRNRLIIMFFVDLGIRNLELCSLTHLNIMETIIQIRGKGNKDRHLYVSPLLKKYMIKYERIKHEYFKDKLMIENNYFLSRNGKTLTIDAIEKIIKEAGKRAKVRDSIRCSPHTIRHYYAQKQLKLGLDVYSLSRLLGHESTMITTRYLQSLNDENIVEMAKSTSPLSNL
ncbi:recombinase [Heyndrickxia shackletonii]|uniref:Recombinase n=1 Tax=Heyndrickxia shackletonii TaxID=157838 RepID=A0A0Q3WYI4_9BACI|nr:tyrosine-type recombinase/integrase [Heyndrickxia shackletonii]KQL54068.1 recombinase [Heyndrickxia shackletonii]NEY99384.1 tyrosine-type recombinase/integrase [Heyndrickxia shackletonii]